MGGSSFLCLTGESAEHAGHHLLVRLGEGLGGGIVCVHMAFDHLHEGEQLGDRPWLTRGGFIHELFDGRFELRNGFFPPLLGDDDRFLERPGKGGRQVGGTLRPAAWIP
jgi:hypothetical protein